MLLYVASRRLSMLVMRIVHFATRAWRCPKRRILYIRFGAGIEGYFLDTAGTCKSVLSRQDRSRLEDQRVGQQANLVAKISQSN